MRDKLGKRLMKGVGIALCAMLLCANGGEQMQYIRGLPHWVSSVELSKIEKDLGGFFSVAINGEEDIFATNGLDESLSGDGADIKLLGIPVKKLYLEERRDILVMPGGMSIGVSIYADGALVVGLGSVREDEEYCPAAKAGIRAGDVILEVEGQAVESTKQLEELCAVDGEVDIKVLRGDKIEEFTVRPEYNREDDAYRVGMWVRDSTSGIGTLSFCNMETGRYGALGHPITDADTGSIIAVKEGNAVHSSIVGISAGKNGVPGEVIGSFSLSSREVGNIDTNCEYGIYGQSSNVPVNPLYPQGATIAYPDEIREGEAQILSAVDGEVKAYSCEIIKLYEQREIGSKGMVVKVTDRALIDLTGGIVQGM